MHQALPPDIVITIILVASRWLQEVLTSTDLLAACVTGALSYFRAFEEASLKAEEEMGDDVMHDLLRPPGVRHVCPTHAHTSHRSFCFLTCSDSLFLYVLVFVG